MLRGGWVGAIGLLSLSCSRPEATPSRTILVSAASSLTDAMGELGRAYSKRHPTEIVRFNFGASGSLALQIKQRAPVDVFASAGAKEMDELDALGLITDRTRVTVASNRLVLIAPIHSKLSSWDGLADGSVRRIALPHPDFVPSGRYGKATLEKRHLWDRVKSKCIFCQNVRQSLTYVLSDEVEAGIVFATDAATASSGVRVVAEAMPGIDHPAISYPVAAMRYAPNIGGGKAFVDFVSSDEGRAIIRKFGFAPAEK